MWFDTDVSVEFGDLSEGREPNAPAHSHSSLGVMGTDGFNTFLWRETEGTFYDQKLSFADDLTFSVNSSAVPVPSSFFALAIMWEGGLSGYGGRRRVQQETLWMNQQKLFRGLFPLAGNPENS